MSNMGVAQRRHDNLNIRPDNVDGSIFTPIFHPFSFFTQTLNIFCFHLGWCHFVDGIINLCSHLWNPTFCTSEERLAPRGIGQHILAVVCTCRPALIQCMGADTRSHNLCTHASAGTITLFTVCSISWHTFTSLARFSPSLSRNTAGGWDVSSDDFSGSDGPGLPRTVNTPATVELDRGQIPAQHAGLDKA